MYRNEKYYVKTKRQILIDKRLFSIMLFAIVGIYCAVRGIYGMTGTTHAMTLDKLTHETCKNGRYVAGYIESYVVKPKGGTGVSAMINGSAVLTIPIADEEYISILISSKNKDVIDGLNKFSNGSGEGVWFEGRIEKWDHEVNESWFREIEQFKGEGIKKIVPDYVVRGVHFETQKNWLSIGLILLGIAGIRIWFAGGKTGILQEREEKEIRYKEEWAFYGENKLKQERIWLAYFERQLNRLKKYCLFKIPFFYLESSSQANVIG